MTLRILSDQEHAELEQQYKYRRIRCVHMPEDPRPVPPGTEGYCYAIDGAGHLLMHWGNGQSLNLIPGTDKFKVLNDVRRIK